MAGEDILGSTNEEVVSVLSTFTASGGMFASLNLLQAFNPQLCLKWSILMCLDIRFLWLLDQLSILKVALQTIHVDGGSPSYRSFGQNIIKICLFAMGDEDCLIFTPFSEDSRGTSLVLIVSGLVIQTRI